MTIAAVDMSATRPSWAKAASAARRRRRGGLPRRRRRASGAVGSTRDRRAHRRARRTRVLERRQATARSAARCASRTPHPPTRLTPNPPTRARPSASYGGNEICITESVALSSAGAGGVRQFNVGKWSFVDVRGATPRSSFVHRGRSLTLARDRARSLVRRLWTARCTARWWRCRCAPASFAGTVGRRRWRAGAWRRRGGACVG